MDFVGAISHRMSSAEREALANAVEQVDDFLLSELVKLHDDTKPARTRMFSCPFLPTRSADLYDFAMLRRLYVALTAVAGRFRTNGNPLDPLRPGLRWNRRPPHLRRVATRSPRAPPIDLVRAVLAGQDRPPDALVIWKRPLANAGARGLCAPIRPVRAAQFAGTQARLRPRRPGLSPGSSQTFERSKRADEEWVRVTDPTVGPSVTPGSPARPGVR